MQITCKKCGADIPAANINLDRLIAKCDKCNAVFSFADSLETDSLPDKPKGKPKLDVPMPNGFEIHDNGLDLVITRRWLSWTTIPLTIFAVLWDGFLILWYGMALSSGAGQMLLCGGLHVAIGIGVTYMVIANYLNTTTIRASAQNIDVRHAPVPFPGKSMNAEGLKQFYTKERYSRNSRRSSATYEVHTIDIYDKDDTLIGGLELSEQALFIEQEIERFLHIPDQAVRGEYMR